MSEQGGGFLLGKMSALLTSQIIAKKSPSGCLYAFVTFSRRRPLRGTARASPPSR